MRTALFPQLVNAKELALTVNVDTLYSLTRIKRHVFPAGQRE